MAMACIRDLRDIDGRQWLVGESNACSMTPPLAWGCHPLVPPAVQPWPRLTPYNLLPSLPSHLCI